MGTASRNTEQKSTSNLEQECELLVAMIRSSD